MSVQRWDMADIWHEHAEPALQLMSVEPHDSYTKVEEHHSSLHLPDTESSYSTADLHRAQDQHLNGATRTITSKAQNCLRLLTRLPEQIDRGQAAATSHLSAQAQDELSRFSIWLDNVGIHLDSGPFLGERLRGSRELQRELARLLTELQNAIETATSTLEPHEVYDKLTDLQRLELNMNFSATTSAPPPGAARGICPITSCGIMVDDLNSHISTHADVRPEKCPVSTCVYYTKGFARLSDRDRHICTHFDGTMICSFCHKGPSGQATFQRVDIFKRHLSTEHGATNDSQSELLGHPNDDEPIPPTSHGICSVCSERFANPRRLYNHLQGCIVAAVEKEIQSDHERSPAVQADNPELVIAPGESSSVAVFEPGFGFKPHSSGQEPLLTLEGENALQNEHHVGGREVPVSSDISSRESEDEIEDEVLTEQEILESAIEEIGDIIKCLLRLSRTLRRPETGSDVVEKRMGHQNELELPIITLSQQSQVANPITTGPRHAKHTVEFINSPLSPPPSGDRSLTTYTKSSGAVSRTRSGVEDGELASPRAARLAPRSRPLNTTEAWAIYHYENHARDCAACYETSSTVSNAKAPCAAGEALALDVAQYVFMRAGTIYSTTQANGSLVSVEIPYHYYQLRSRLRAMELAQEHEVGRTYPSRTIFSDTLSRSPRIYPVRNRSTGELKRSSPARSSPAPPVIAYPYTRVPGTRSASKKSAQDLPRPSPSRSSLYDYGVESRNQFDVQERSRRRYHD